MQSEIWLTLTNTFNQHLNQMTYFLEHLVVVKYCSLPMGLSVVPKSFGEGFTPEVAKAY